MDGIIIKRGSKLPVPGHPFLQALLASFSVSSLLSFVTTVLMQAAETNSGQVRQIGHLWEGPEAGLQQVRTR